MNKARLHRLQRELQRPEDDGRIVLPASEEGRHRMILDGLSSLIELYHHRKRIYRPNSTLPPTS
jgi:hypothetical protein